MQKILDALRGFKTYIICFVAGILWLGTVFQVWTIENVKELFGLLAILGVAALRDGMNNS